MSRLDRHVTVVRNKLALQRLLDGLAWLALGYIVVAWAAILLNKLLAVRIPAWWSVAQIAAGAVVVAAVIYAIARRPRAAAAAVAIDQRLKLKEKFSTALSVRRNSDPFAQAVVTDAEHTAHSVRLDQQFGVEFPRSGYWAISLGFMVFLTVLFVPAMDLLGHEEQAKKKQEQLQAVQTQAKEQVQHALAILDSLPKAVAESNNEFKVLQKDLENLATQRTLQDPDGAKRKAVEALQQVKDALTEAGERQQKIVADQNRQLNEKLGDIDRNGPLGPVADALKSGNLAKAIDELDKTAEEFENKKPEDQEKTTKEMEKLAEKLAEMANDPKNQEKIAEQLKNAGVSPQTAKQMAQQMQAAANGDKQAQQNLSQAAQQLQQQLNSQLQQAQQQAAAGNQAAQQQVSQLQAQQQALQQAMQAAQSSANSQAQANAMSQAAQQMAKAMSQCQQGSQSSNNGSQSANGQSPQSSAQAMAQAKQAMNSAMAQMQQSRADQQMINAQQAAADKAAQNAASSCSGNSDGTGNSSNNNGNGQNQANGNGDWQQGDANNQGGGMGGPGIGNGGRASKQFAPSSFKPEMDPSQTNEEGKLLAGTMIKDHTPRGESKATLAQVGASQLKEGTDEVESDRITGPSRKAAQEYFRTMVQDAGQKN